MSATLQTRLRDIAHGLNAANNQAALREAADELDALAAKVERLAQELRLAESSSNYNGDMLSKARTERDTSLVECARLVRFLREIASGGHTDLEMLDIANTALTPYGGTT